MDGMAGPISQGRVTKAAADRNSWPECTLLGLEEVLESGDLDWVEAMLGGLRTQRVLDLHEPNHDARIRAVRDGLAAARVREAVHGRDSLIDPNHPITLLWKRHQEWLAVQGEGFVVQ